ncbi:rod shape-determining protein RodA [Desulfosporosinus sp. BICA1-9]|uniref:rod shape-determining protein RodA n=1 Tax=Desulfosporosinus sp. BICA1-9 TaxID=1531958 RepID=UPI00054B1D8C|nr:rod shape-determining protein RodA [Desulfosporosinus sp. BICA1-9]KJS48035.1 MAG: rod shape-determining protein RodA [Peptococcaceae bacterium BRH_c23]KJS90713.1 MAG: rod shape-determining protein RodA [Desulfosporosinus sp. BICA1-9]HBW39018.1 rod shape-determining protein RodA [Desulfosporosinus sp.]
MFDKQNLKNLDLSFVGAVLLLLATSLFVLSTASYNLVNGQPNYYVELQAMWILSGIFLAIMVTRIDYQELQKFSGYIYGFNILLLLAVFVFGSEAKGATRWIPITSSFSIQPSEFAKIFMILSFADFLVKRQGKLNRFRDFIAPFLYVLVPMLLIFKQPDLGTSLVFAAIFIGMMLIAGANIRKFCGLLLTGVTAVGIALWLHFSTSLPGWLKFAEGLPLPLKDYQLKRLTVFMNPASDSAGDGYNILQSMWALGSGGLWGKGYRQGTQGQLSFLPEHHTDFIFAVFSEEFGFIGVIILLFFFLIFLIRGINIAMQARDLYGVLIAAGIITMISFHILVNVGMNSGIMPVTGIPLPFISYGGSAMWANMISIGLLLSINLRSQRLLFQ